MNGTHQDMLTRITPYFLAALALLSGTTGADICLQNGLHTRILICIVSFSIYFRYVDWICFSGCFN